MANGIYLFANEIISHWDIGIGRHGPIDPLGNPWLAPTSWCTSQGQDKKQGPLGRLGHPWAQDGKPKMESQSSKNPTAFQEKMHQIPHILGDCLSCRHF